MEAVHEPGTINVVFADIAIHLCLLDVQLLKDQVEAELLSHVERVERRKTEMTLMTNRKDVETLYHQLRSKGESKFMPSLSTFRQLPVIAMLQSAESSASASVAQTLSSNDVMQKLLTTQLKKWTEKAMQDLGHTLGFPKNWKNASKNILHPVERVTARFLCKKCQRVDVKYRDNECLDFEGACLHECGVGNAKKGRVQQGKKNIWESSKFIKDDKVSQFQFLRRTRVDTPVGYRSIEEMCGGVELP